MATLPNGIASVIAYDLSFAGALGGADQNVIAAMAQEQPTSRVGYHRKNHNVSKLKR